MNTAIRGAGLALTTLIAAGSLTAFAMPAQAKDHGGGDDRVEARGACTGGGHWKLKAKHDEGRIEYEFEVDTNKVGQRWTVKVWRWCPLRWAWSRTGARRSSRPGSSVRT